MVHPLANERNGKRKIGGFQRRNIFTDTMHVHYPCATCHITVTCNSPGWIQTNDYERLRPEDHAQYPSRRVGIPEDIARMCLLLCQEEYYNLNGGNIIIGWWQDRQS